MARMCLPSMLLLGLVLVSPDLVAQRADGVAPSATCAPSGGLVRLRQLSEASGIAASSRTPGRLWAHNDSGDPVLVALDEKGAVVGRVTVMGIEVEDWEALAIGPCPQGSCIYLADIGDNNASRKYVTIYRVPEPAGAPESVAATDRFDASYPDGPHDAETLLVTPDGAIFIVTKGDGDEGRIGIYRFPEGVQPGTIHKLERVGKPYEVRSSRDLITDGSVSFDGRWVAFRSNTSLTIFQTKDFVSGVWMQARRIDLTPVREPQGEGVTLGRGNAIFLVGEGGPSGHGGTFVRFVCPFGS